MRPTDLLGGRVGFRSNRQRSKVGLSSRNTDGGRQSTLVIPVKRSSGNKTELEESESDRFEQHCTELRAAWGGSRPSVYRLGISTTCATVFYTKLGRKRALVGLTEDLLREEKHSVDGAHT